MKTQVLIIGAGPTGLSLANQLMRYGIDFVIVDKKETVTELSKAMAVHARSLEIYDQLGLAEKAVGQGQIAHKFRFLNNGEIRAEAQLSDIGKDLTPFPFVLILEQSKNEHLLYDNLTKNGRDVQWQTEIESLSQDAEGVKATLKNANGEITEIEAKYLVGCDGASSKTRHLLNIEFAGSTFPRLFYVADVEMEIALPDDTLNVALGGDSFVLLMPMQGAKHWRLIGNLPADADKDGEVTYAEVETKVKELVKISLEITKVNWFSSYKIHTRHAEKFAAGRCFLAGDSAHVHTPAGGQGMNTGIQDAYNLAWKIAFALKGLATEKLLETYNEERLANAKRLLQTTDRMFEFMTDDNSLLQVFRERIFPIAAKFALQFETVKSFIFPTISQIGISYHKNSLSKHGADATLKIKAGNRFPYFKVEEKSIYEMLNAPKFHYISFHDGTNSPEIKADLSEKFAETVDCFSFPLYPKIAEIFGTNKSFSVLVRPDNHIAFIANENMAGDLETYLNALKVG